MYAFTFKPLVKFNRIWFGLILLPLLCWGTYAQAISGPTLKNTIARGSLLCSTAGSLHTDPLDLQKPGSIAGFDRDFCRAIAAAIFGDPTSVKLTQLVPKNRFQALQDGAVDVLVRTTTWTLKRDTSLGVHFAATNFYDGQGFMAPKSLGVTSLLDLRKFGKTATACVEKDTTSAKNIIDYIKDHNLPIKVLEFNAFEELRYAFHTGRCNLYTGDRSFLIEVRISNVPVPQNYMILDDIISKEPLGIAVRDNDPQWFNIVRWVFNATVQAEELGITSVNVDDLKANGTSVQRRLLGADPGFGKDLGLSDDWAYQVIKHVGNYGEIFERNVGQKTIYGLKRSINDLWNRGGLMYAPPFH